MTPDQQKVGAAVLQEAASTARRSIRRYREEAGAEAVPETIANFVTHAEACEACLVELNRLTPQG